MVFTTTRSPSRDRAGELRRARTRARGPCRDRPRRAAARAVPRGAHDLAGPVRGHRCRLRVRALTERVRRSAAPGRGPCGGGRRREARVGLGVDAPRPRPARWRRPTLSGPRPPARITGTVDRAARSRRSAPSRACGPTRRPRRSTGCRLSSSSYVGHGGELAGAVATAPGPSTPTVAISGRCQSRSPIAATPSLSSTSVRTTCTTSAGTVPGGGDDRVAASVPSESTTRGDAGRHRRQDRVRLVRR